ncbi:MAG: hypothetical protein GX197_06535 [Firmicutes bacterium]|nr:hypothetical protein [Bacillota bacterium]
MKKHAGFSVLLIFLFFFFLLYTGLTVSERALQQLSGVETEPLALRLGRDEAGVWELRFAGRLVRFASGQWQVLKNK